MSLAFLTEMQRLLSSLTQSCCSPRHWRVCTELARLWQCCQTFGPATPAMTAQLHNNPSAIVKEMVIKVRKYEKIACTNIWKCTTLSSHEIANGYHS